MALKQELEQRVNAALAQVWNVREGEVVPESDSVVLAGGMVKIKATVLYADLAASTELVMHNRQTAARVFKAYLSCSTHLIRDHGGEIRSFDGDRVMGVFIGCYKNTSAAKCALKINYAFKQIIVPKLKAKYEVFQNGTLSLKQGVGIDTSYLFAVRCGIRDNNDLIWVGRAANIAAKLSSIRENGYSTYITDDVFNSMADEGKYGGDPRSLMWERRSWIAGEKLGVETIYRSSWRWPV